MKIRLQKGSIRFRLRQGDVRNLVTTNRVEEPIQLSNELFVSVIELHSGPPDVRLIEGRLVARIPSGDAHRWNVGADVGLYYNLPDGSRLMIEKDWACLEPRPGETNDDTFARPNSDGVSCGGV